MGTRSKLARLATLVAVMLSATAGWQPATAGTVQSNITYKSVSGLNLKLDVRLPTGTGPFPAIVLIHGGKMITGDKCQTNEVTLAKKFVSAGFVVYLPNFRLAPPYPQNPNLSPVVKCANGTTTNVSNLQGNIYPAGQSDVMDAIRWVKSHGSAYKTATANVSAVGTSSGGTFAYTAGNQGLVDAAVGWSSPTKFDDTWGTPAEIADYFGCSYNACPGTWSDGSPLSHVTSGGSATAIYNSSNESVPKWQADNYYQALVSHSVAANETIIPGTKHATAYENYVLPNGKTVWRDTADFIKAHQ